ncbi:MAG: AI-2E family transporter [Gemmatimonadota bacterium]
MTVVPRLAAPAATPTAPPPSAASETATVVKSAPRLHRIEITTRTFITLVLVIVTCWSLMKLAPVILMVVAALMLVGSLSPTVEKLEARGMKRGLAIGLVFGALLGIVALLITFTIPELFAQGSSLVEREPMLREQLAQWLDRYRMTKPLASSLRQVEYSALLGTGQGTLRTSMRVFEIMAYTVGALFLALYVMLDRDRLRGALFSLVPRSHHIALSRILLNLERIVGGFIRGQVITCVLMGIFIFILLTAVGVQSALAIAVFAGIADILPYIGGLLILAPAVLAALTISPTAAVTVAVLITIYQEVESRLLIPMVYGRALRLPSSVILVALLAGGVLYGLVGALLALPVAAAALMLIEELRVDLPGQSETPDKEKQRELDTRYDEEYTARTEGLPVDEAAAIALSLTDDRARDDDITLAPVTDDGAPRSR